MSKVDSMVLQTCTYLPDVLQPGVLYYSKMYHIAAHLCACGCKQQVYTPIVSEGWVLHLDHSGVTLTPSIGNFQQPCKSHYFIKEGKVVWA